jgi:hypothetical protein
LLGQNAAQCLQRLPPGLDRQIGPQPIDRTLRRLLSSARGGTLRVRQMDMTILLDGRVVDVTGSILPGVAAPTLRLWARCAGIREVKS